MGDPVEGQGVPAGELQRMFDDYHIERHAEASNERVENHFGIGLSIARRNVEAMGGQTRRKPNTTRLGGPPSLPLGITTTWTGLLLLAGLAPARMAASLAAPDLRALG